MTGWSDKQLRAALAIAAVLALSLFVTMCGRGREAEDAFRVTGQPRTDLREVASPSGGSPSPTRASVPTAQSPHELVVHVAGAVKRPGLYRIAPDARCDDAIKLAGGAKDDANLDAVNLAARLEDGQQLYVPTRKEQPTGGAAPTVRPDGGKTPASRAGRTVAKLTKPGQGVVNLNTASEQELQKLPGVGPAMAQRILQFRSENGRFTSLEQLMDVSGIGPKKFDKMKAFVVVR